MNISEVVITVVGALIAYIIANTLVTQLITGTATGDLLIQSIVPKKLGAFRSNPDCKTSQSRGNLNRAVGKAIPNQAKRAISWACVETRRFASFGMVG